MSFRIRPERLILAQKITPGVLYQVCTMGCGARRCARRRSSDREEVARRLESDYDKYEKVTGVSGAKIG